MTGNPSVFVLGLDAADHALIERWAAAGELPTFSALLKEGTYGILESTAAIFSGSAWPSITSGSNPAKCGVYTRYQIANGTYDIRRIKAADNRQPPFWAAFSGPVVVIDVPKAPLTTGLAGAQVVEWGAYDHYSEFSSMPTEFSDRLVNEFGPHPFLDRNFEVALHRRRDFDALKATLIEGIQMKLNLNLKLMKELRPRFFLSVFGETHAAGHAFWRFQDPHHPHHEENNSLASALLDIYRSVDRAIGEFMQALPPDSIFAVVSSQGFCLDSMAGEDFLGEVLVRTGHSVPKLKKTTHSAYVPAITLDMTRTKAFSLPTDLQGYVRINLHGREPNGIVPESEYDSVCDALAAELLALRHRDSGAPVVNEVVRIRQTFSGPLAAELPDLSVIWHTSQVVTEVESPTCGIIRVAQDLLSGGGNHRGMGFMLVHGANVAASRFAGHVFDIAPTVSQLLGEAVQPGWDGRALAFSSSENHDR